MRQKDKTNSYTEIYTEIYALSQHICMSAHKARRIIDQIRGRSYEETLMILELMPYRVCYPIFKLVYSAAANGSHNKGFKEASLVISKAEVNEAPTVKKLKPRARGRSYLLKRPTCHITIVLRDLAVDISDLYRDGTVYPKRIDVDGYRLIRLKRRGGWVWDKK
uniref:ribosomal protein L22 n=1 Tax=Dialyceras coriaceum TaxID=142721 RepID=UPI001EE0F1B6|nr:ribosomal protein L22 [Dialyceras coriaceum]UIR97860.1 ribosomal protein L22 [Dialyceras coriaceum]